MVVEMVCILLTGALHLVFESLLGWKVPYIIVAALGWGTYIVIRARQHPELLDRWGIRQMASGDGWLTSMLFALPAAAALATYALCAKTLRLDGHLLAIAAIYPIFGILQQFVLNALLAANLSDLLPGKRVSIVVISALLFGLVHAPDVPLMACTFVAGLVWVPLFLRCRNLLPLGICHGLLGTLTYYWILGRDPWAEILAEIARVM